MQQRGNEGRHQTQLQTTSYGTPIQGSERGKGKGMGKARDRRKLFSSQFFPVHPSSYVHPLPHAPISHQPLKAQLLPLHIPKGPNPITCIEIPPNPNLFFKIYLFIWPRSAACRILVPTNRDRTGIPCSGSAES